MGRISMGCRVLLAGFLAIIAGAAPRIGQADVEHYPKRMRVDCRYYGENQKFCYASAIYFVADDRLNDIKFGVGCDRQTIYNDTGTYIPQEMVADAIRPRTAATPRIDLKPGGALRNPGTYLSVLEIESTRIENGVCYVSEFRDSDYLNTWSY